MNCTAAARLFYGRATGCAKYWRNYEAAMALIIVSFAVVDHSRPLFFWRKTVSRGEEPRGRLRLAYRIHARFKSRVSAAPSSRQEGVISPSPSALGRIFFPS